MEGRTLTPVGTPQRASSGLGTRLRQLRVAAGLTQSDLASDRFSKEYVSQIERGKTRPTPQTLTWIAERLGVDVSYLETGQTWDEYAEVEAAVMRAEAAVEGQRFEEALEALEGVAHSPEARELEFRAMLAESWARMSHGELRPALDLLTRARDLSEQAGFSDVERADVLYRMGVCRYKLTSINTAVTLLSEALDLADRSEFPCDRLRSHILEWRSRCSRRQRDFEAAREDIERALELADRLDDTLTVAHVTFQASIVAERARELYEVHGDRKNVGRLLNNLGGLNYLLGKPDDAIDYLKRAFSVALEVGSEPDAAQAVSSLAQVHLGAGDWTLAEEQSRHALELLEGRPDFLDEAGNALIVLGRALMEQDRLDEAQQAFAEAELNLSQLSSASHRAVAWTAQGDLATRRGEDRAAATLYRRAAEALQDVRF